MPVILVFPGLWPDERAHERDPYYYSLACYDLPSSLYFFSLVCFNFVVINFGVMCVSQPNTNPA